MHKTSTDLHWNERVLDVNDDAKVNIDDTTQRDAELDFILDSLRPNSKLLEVGCGNGYVTQILRQKCNHIDAFDYAENMVGRARELYGERNNRFFHDSILEPRHVAPPYDQILCVRVLINLVDFEQQKTALANMSNLLEKDGELILIEGFSEGFGALNELRRKCGVEELNPASINYYSSNKEFMEYAGTMFTVKREFHTGLFDFLTRVVYPCLVGGGAASGHGEFHQKIESLVRSFQVDELSYLARVHGYVLAKR